MKLPPLLPGILASLAFLPEAPSQQTDPLPAPAATPAPPAPQAPVEEKAPASAEPVLAEPASAAATYTIRAGDNPWKIAQRHGIKVEDLLKANEIKDPKKLKIGDVLKLPGGTTAKPAAAAAPQPPQAPAPPLPAEGDNWELYTVKSGDNPWKIAKALKVEHAKILSLNEGLDFTRLKIGQQIRVPKKP